MKNYLAVLPVAVACTLFLTGCEEPKPAQSMQSSSATGDPPPVLPSPSPQSDIAPDKPVTQAGRDITIYAVAEDKDGNRSLQPKTVPLPTGFTQTPALFALESLMNTDNSPVPKGTKLRSVKIGADGVATVDFSHEFKDNFAGGDTNEALVINAVLSTLGQFKSVKAVQILLDGEKIDSLGGNQSLDEPLSVPQRAGSRDSKDEVTKGASR